MRASRLEESQVAGISNAALALGTVVLVGCIFTRQRRLFGSAILPETRRFDIAMLTCVAFLVVALTARSVGLAPGLGFAPYLACLLFLLMGAIQVFVRIVFYTSDDGSDDP